MSKKTTTKSKSVFILDRPSFIELRKLIQDLPGIGAIDAAELRLREARTAFLEHSHRVRTDSNATLEAMALRLNDPRKLEEPAREYHRALLEWCKLAVQAFEVVHNEQADDVNTRGKDFQKYANLAQNHPLEDGRAAAEAEVRRIKKLDAEPYRIMRAAIQGRNACKAAFHFATGRSMQEANENAYAAAMDPLGGKVA